MTRRDLTMGTRMRWSAVCLLVGLAPVDAQPDYGNRLGTNEEDRFPITPPAHSCSRKRSCPR